jgi:hypothetical protein
MYTPSDLQAQPIQDGTYIQNRRKTSQLKKDGYYRVEAVVYLTHEFGTWKRATNFVVLVSSVDSGSVIRAAPKKGWVVTPKTNVPDQYLVQDNDDTDSAIDLALVELAKDIQRSEKDHELSLLSDSDAQEESDADQLDQRPEGDRDAHDPAFPSGGFEVDTGTSGSQPIRQQKGSKRQREHGNGQTEGYQQPDQGPDLAMHVRLKQMEKELLRSQKELLLLQQRPPPQQQQQVSFMMQGAQAQFQQNLAAQAQFQQNFVAAPWPIAPVTTYNPFMVHGPGSEVSELKERLKRLKREHIRAEHRSLLQREHRDNIIVNLLNQD